MNSSASDQEQASQSTTVDQRFANLALVALVSTILLIIMGGIVRVTGHGLGCPDWPLCYGQAVPPFKLGAWVEFTHRLLGGVVVAEVAVLILMAWRHYRRIPRLFRIAPVAAVVLIIQVTLGGIHVLYELPRWTGWVHTGIAMILVGLVAIWVARSHPRLLALSERAGASLAGHQLSRWIAITAVATYLLLMSGSLVTRSGASLVCPEFPACGLEVVPDILRNVVDIQMFHRYAAFTVASSITLVLWKLIRVSRTDAGFRSFAVVTASLLVAQFTLGMINVFFSIPRWSRILHLGTGATIWAMMVLLWVVATDHRERQVT